MNATGQPEADKCPITGKTMPQPEPKQLAEGEQRTLVLTGASQGIGHATAKLFEEKGWRVITCSRRAFSTECPWQAGEEDHIQIDLGDPDHRSIGLAELKKRLSGGALHALVNNAGISPKNGTGGRLGPADTGMATWRLVFEVNFFAPIVLARGLMDELTKGRGSVVNVTSIAGSRVHPFAGTAYATSKAALAALTREMAWDFGARGIRVNAIAPGEIDTPILSPGTSDLVESIPLHRLGTPEEVAQTIYFLCAEQSSYVTGSEVHINGGEHL
ncbi:MAG: SDR family NAD(P)-dependent oxidoreductase [Acidiferrobacterales bacterium]|nr:SDR family NAD(P)-dependent oxidoreductase [Acidiferrobacterales bacterium]